MANVCKVCDHPERDAIDLACTGTESNCRIATKYGLGEKSVREHRKNHLPATVAKSADAAEATRADTLLAQVIKHRDNAAWFVQQAQDIVREAREAKALGAAIEAIKSVAAPLREAKGALELLGRVTGELQDKPAVHIDARTVQVMSDRELLESVAADVNKRLGR